MSDDHFYPRLTRPAALRLAAAGMAGLVLDTRTARAAPTEIATVEAAARAFLASLSPAAHARASFPFEGDERTRWHWTVPAAVPRNGLPLGDTSPAQRKLALALLRSSSSPTGYRKAIDIMALQGVLQRMDTGLGDPFDPNLYFVSVFGTPGARVWGWRLEGHHLSRHFTVVRNSLVAEPFFLGAWPTRAGSAYRSVAKGYRTMAREEDAAREIVLLLDRRLRRQVVFSSDSLTDHLTQNAVRVRPLERVGVATDDLPSAAQRRVLEIITRTSRTIHPRWPARSSRGSNERASVAPGSAGPAARDPAYRSTTGCKGRRSFSSSTIHGTAALTSTASGAISSATSDDTCSRHTYVMRRKLNPLVLSGRTQMAEPSRRASEEVGK